MSENNSPTSGSSRPLLSMLLGYWKAEKKVYQYSILFIVLAANVGFVYMSVRLNKWTNDFYNALQKLDQEAVFSLLSTFLLIIVIFVFFFVLAQYLQGLLGFKWRTWMTRKWLKNWTANNNFYYVMSKGGVENPDQRISEDISNFSKLSIMLFVTTFTQLLSLVSFSVVLWGLSKAVFFGFFGQKIYIPGYLVWAALLYATVGTAIMIWVGRPLIQLDFLQEKLEANFRFGLIRLQEKREEVALHNGAMHEKEGLMFKFQHIQENFYNILIRKLRINIFHNFYFNLSTMFPILVASPIFFAGIITFGALMQIASAFGTVQDSLSVVVTNFQTIATWKASAKRLLELDARMKEAHHDFQNNPINITYADTGVVQISNLNLYKPDGEVIIKNLNMEIQPGEKVLIKGKSGVGKSTLVRSIKGLWTYGSGEITMPKDKVAFFLPQKPYMPAGTLLEAILYPDVSVGKQNFTKLLKDFGLSHLENKMSAVEDWSNTLSLGEQQRISMIRVLVHKPDIIVLDEATSSLDKEYEEIVMEALFNALPKSSVLMINHGGRVDRFFSKVVKL